MSVDQTAVCDGCLLKATVDEIAGGLLFIQIRFLGENIVYDACSELCATKLLKRGMGVIKVRRKDAEKLEMAKVKETEDVSDS